MIGKLAAVAGIDGPLLYSAESKNSMPNHSKFSGFLAMLYIKADTNKITDNVRPLTQIVPAAIAEANSPSGEPSFTIKL